MTANLFTVSCSDGQAGIHEHSVRTETSPPPGMRTLALEGFLDEDRRKLSGVEGGMFTASARAGRIEPSIGFISWFQPPPSFFKRLLVLRFRRCITRTKAGDSRSSNSRTRCHDSMILGTIPIS